MGVLQLIIVPVSMTQLYDYPQAFIQSFVTPEWLAEVRIYCLSQSSKITDRPKVIFRADYRQPVQFFKFNVPLFNSSSQIYNN